MQWFSLQYLHCTIKIVRVLWIGELHTMMRWPSPLFWQVFFDHGTSSLLLHFVVFANKSARIFVFFWELQAPIRKRVACLVWWVTSTMVNCGKNGRKIQVMYVWTEKHILFTSGPFFFFFGCRSHKYHHFFSAGGGQGKSFLTSYYYIWHNFPTTYPSLSPTLQYIIYTYFVVCGGGCWTQKIAHKNNHHHP